MSFTLYLNCDLYSAFLSSTSEYGSNVYEVVNQLQVSGKSVVYTTVKSICHSNSSIMGSLILTALYVCRSSPKCLG